MSETNKELIEAVQKGVIKKVCYLVRRGADVNQKDEHGHPLLHIAIVNGSRNLVESLLLLGADVNKKDDLGVSPLVRAIKMNRLKVMRRFFSEENLVVNEKDKFGFTPLHFAACAGLDVDDLKALIVSGADVNAKNNWGDTPIYLSSNAKTMQNLLHLGALYNIKNKWGQTPLEYFYQESKQKASSPFRRLKYRQMVIQLQKQAQADQFMPYLDKKHILQPKYDSQLKRVGFLKYKKMVWKNERE